MTNAELLAKIREEIERRRSLLTQHSKLTYDLILETFIKEYDDLLSFLSTLESEKPVPNDIEEAAVDIADALLAKSKDYVLSAKADYWNGAHDGIIAGAKWKKEQMISALKNDGDLPIEFIDKFHEIDRTAFQNGQANMKEKMMKEAAEGQIVATAIGHLRIVAEANEKSGVKDGDKVRIIIVKEDEK